MQTELGKIAAALEKKEDSKEKGWRYKWYKVKVALGVEDTTPLQKK
jgi:Na+-exporting ATPase